ncbi:MAG: hypothetical protein JW862_09715 [Anaerolineales bacterium]|nr:hypothetical protein [Anaerolineales bacterium]
MKRTAVLLLALSVSLFAALWTGWQSGQALTPPIQPQGAGIIEQPGLHFLHIASAGNSVDHVTYLDHPVLNSNPDAVFQVTQVWNPNGLSGTYNNATIGIFYSVIEERWAIWNQDFSDISLEAAFNIHIPMFDSTSLVHDATVGNTAGIYTVLSHPLLDGNPMASVFVTQNYNPSGQPGVANPHEVGAWYSSCDGQWVIYNQDAANMPEGASFNVLIASPDEETLLHTTTADNTNNHVSRIDDERINGNPNAILTVTPSRSPECALYPSPHPIGVYYFSGSWYIFNQDLTVMPEGIDFNIQIPPLESAAFTHVATSANIVEDVITVIDHPAVNGKPLVAPQVTANWNPGGWGGFYNDHPIGVVYYEPAERWGIYNQDLKDMPIGAAFNVFVPPAGANNFHQFSSADNSSFNSTYLNHPQTNDYPGTYLFVTQSYDPLLYGGTSNPHPTGVWYDDLFDQHAIFNQDMSNMPQDVSFNVFIPGPDSISFLHTATVGNSIGNYTLLDHPLLNDNPYALAFVTQSWNPGGIIGGVYNDAEVGVWYSIADQRWSIFNQDGSLMPQGAAFNVLVFPQYKLFSPLITR